MKYLLSLSLSLFFLRATYSQAPSYSSLYGLDHSQIEVVDAVIDSDGNTYVIGVLKNHLVNFSTTDGVTVNANGYDTYGSLDSYSDGFVVKYNSSNELNWVKGIWTNGPVTYQSQNYDPALNLRNINLGDDGNIYIVGDVKGSANGLGDQHYGSTYANGSIWRSFVRGLNPAGTVVFNGSNTHSTLSAGSLGYDVAADASGNVYMTGVFVDRINGHEVGSSGQWNVFVTEFASNETITSSGYVVDTYDGVFDIARNAVPSSIAVDGSGNIHIAGYFGEDADFNPSGTAQTETTTNTQDGFIAKYNDSYALQWVNTYSTEGDNVNRIELDASSNVYASVGDHIVKLNSSGVEQWNRDLGYESNFVLDSDENLLITRLEDELRWLKLTSSNAISFQVNPSLLNASVPPDYAVTIGELSNGNIKWVLKDIGRSDFPGDGAFPYEEYTGLVIADYEFIDEDPPLISALSPANGAENVTPNGDLLMTFNENINLNEVASSAAIQVYTYDGNSQVESFQLTSDNVTVQNGNQILVTGLTNLQGNTKYWVRLYSSEAFIFYDHSDNGFVPWNFDKSKWSFTTGIVPDADPPTLQSSSITHESTYTNGILDLTLTFSEDVTINRFSGNFELVILSHGVDYNLNDYITEIGADYVRIRHEGLLGQGKGYAIKIDPIAVDDLAGLSYAGITDNTTLTFTAAWDEPILTSRFPVSNAREVEVDANLTLTFAENVMASSLASQGTYDLQLRTDSGDIIENAKLSEANLNISGNTITYDPTADLDYSKQYRVIVSGNVIETTTAGERWSGLQDPTGDASWYFWTKADPADDMTAPTLNITSTTINNGDEIGHELGEFTLVFDEDVNINSSYGMFQLVRVSGEIVYDLNGYVTSTTSNSITFNYTEQLQNGFEYAIRIDADAVDDIAGNSYAGIAHLTTLAFTISWVEPAVSSTIPTENAEDVSVGISSLSLTFNESIKLGAGDAGSFPKDVYLAIGGGTNDKWVVNDLSVTNNNTIELTPSKPLRYSATYSINWGSQFVEAADGRPMSVGGLSNHFRTMSPVALSSTSIDEGNSIGDVIADISNPDPNPNGTITFSLYEGYADNDQFEIVGNQLRAKAVFNSQTESSYTVAIKASVDQSPHYHPFDTRKDFQITINDVTNPELQNVFPVSGSTNQSIGVSPHLQFDETMTLGDGEIKIYDSKGNLAIKFSKGQNFANMGFGGNRVSLYPPDDFEPNMEYHVIVDSDAITDASGNPYAGISDSEAWTFKTLPTGQAPTDITLSANRFDQNATSNTIIATLSATDGDANTSYYEMIQVPGSGTAYDDFYIAGQTLYLGHGSYDYDTKKEYLIRIKAIDDDNNEFVKDFTLYVNSGQDPELSQMSPTSTDVDPTNVTISFTFDKSVIKHVGNVEVKRKSDDALAESIDIENMMYSAPSTFSYALTADLDYGTEYYVVMPGDLVEDEEGLVNNSISSVDAWNFTTVADTEAPGFNGSQPLSGQSWEHELVRLAFNEKIKIGSGKIAIKEYETHDLVAEYTAGIDEEIEIETGDLVARIQLPTLNTKVSTHYYIEIESGAIVDLSDNPCEVVEARVWHFYSVDDTAPELTSKSPTSENLNPSGLTINFTFDEPVVAHSGNVEVRRTSDDAIANTISIDDFTHTAPATFAYTLSSSLAFDTDYYVLMDDDLVEDDAGNINAGISDKTTWTFSTGSDRASQTITFSEIDDQGYAFESFNLSAQASSGLDVDFELVDGQASLLDGVITFTGLGEVTVRAIQSGNSQYFAADPVERTFSIVKSDQTISVNDIEDKAYGDENFDITFNASSGLDVAVDVSGPVTLDENTVMINGVGTVTLTLDQGGNEKYNAAPQVIKSFEIAKGNQLISLEDIGDKAITDDPFMASATVDSGLPLTYEVSGPATVSDQGEITLSGMEGEVKLIVSQTGNDNYESAKDSVSFNVFKLDQTITFDSITYYQYGDKFKLSATASSDLGVSFAVVSGGATISNDSVTLTGVGEVIISADQAGDDDYNAADQVTRTFNVSKADQTITFDELEDKTFGDETFELSASASSDLGVSFSIVSGSATINENKVAITGAGEIVVAADQAGDDNHNAATQVTQAFDVAKANQSITFDSINNVNLSAGEVQLNASSSSGLQVIYEITEGAATIDGSKVKFDVAGSISVKAKQEGNSDYLAAESVTRTFSVISDITGTTAQSITFELVDSVLENGDPVLLEATASSDLPVTFTVVSGPGNITDGTLTWSGPGLIVVAANQGGNETFSAAMDVTQEIKIIDLFDLQGSVALADGSAFSDGSVYATNGDVEFTTPLTSGGSYHFEGLTEGSWHVKVIPNDQDLYFPTFYGDKLFWEEATAISLNMDLGGIDITLAEKPTEDALSGEGVIEGLIVASNNGRTEWVNGRVEDGTALENVSVFLIRVEDGAILTEVKTDANGEFRIEGIPEGEYELKVEVVGVEMALGNNTISIEDDTPVVLTAMVAEEGIVLEIEEVLSVREQQNVSVYPNPATDFIQIDNLKGKTRLRLFTLDGRQILDIHTTSNERVDVSSVKKGTYLITTTDDRSTTTTKILIQR